MMSFLVLCIIVLTSTQSSFAKGNKTTLEKNSTTIAPIITTSRPNPSGFRLPCTCVAGECGCCTGAFLDRFNQKACMNVSYEPDDFAVTAVMSMNGRILFKRTVSGKNPPPMCFHPPRYPFIEVCVEFSNIYIAGPNFHLCADMEANWQDLTLIEWSFDCIRIGAGGVAGVRPEEGGGVPTSPVDEEEQTDEDYDDSARRAPLPDVGGRLILDESLKKVKLGEVDKRLVGVEKTKSGDVRVWYGRREGGA